MPRPTIDVHGEEYQDILRGRDMYRRHGMDYKEFMWAEDTLTRLENKILLRDYTAQDRADFLKAKALYTRAATKAQRKNAPENHATTHYIWRTRQDGLVRDDHAANDGKIFAWDNPTPTGHPGDGYNCRCWAEPLSEPLKEQKSQRVTSPVNDQPRAWGLIDFLFQYQFGDGKTFSLEEIGLLGRIIHHAQTYNQEDAGGGTTFERIERQIFRKARKEGPGLLTDTFKNGKHDFGPVVWAFGHVPIWGGIKAHIREMGQYFIIEADIDYNFQDRVADLANTYDEKIPNSGLDTPGSTPFYITGKWRTRLDATIRKNSHESLFPDHIQ